MKTRLLIVVLSVFFVTTMSSAYAGVDGKKPTKLLKKFADRVTSHDVKGMLALIDGSYKQVQLIGTLKNDTAKFINEMLCGYNATDNKTFMCGQLSDVKKCTYMKTGEFDSETNSPAYASVNFRVDTFDGRKIKLSLIVVRITTTTGTLFRIAGAVG